MQEGEVLRVEGSQPGNWVHLYPFCAHTSSAGLRLSLDPWHGFQPCHRPLSRPPDEELQRAAQHEWGHWSGHLRTNDRGHCPQHQVGATWADQY